MDVVEVAAVRRRRAAAAAVARPMDLRIRCSSVCLTESFGERSAWPRSIRFSPVASATTATCSGMPFVRGKSELSLNVVQYIYVSQYVYVATW